jgi:hypothetical protein
MMSAPASSTPANMTKTGTHFPPMDSQPAQAEASPAERSDLRRQLVPVISPGKIETGDRDRDAAAQDPSLSLSQTSIFHVHDPHPDHLPIPDDHLSSTGRIKDANADFFD